MNVLDYVMLVLLICCGIALLCMIICSIVSMRKSNKCDKEIQSQVEIIANNFNERLTKVETELKKLKEKGEIVC